MMYGRRPGQLVAVWGSSALLIALIRWFEKAAPAFHEILQPFYWIILAVAFFFTWRWLRSRSKKDRRGPDRRHIERREDTDSLRPSE